MESRREIAGGRGGGALTELIPTGQDWQIPGYLRNLQSVALAVLTLDGTVLDANRGFVELTIGAGTTGTWNASVYFQAPGFDRLRSVAESDARQQDGFLHRGLITLGPVDAPGKTVRGAIHRSGDRLLFVGEHDIADLSRLTDTVIELNEELANKQRELVRTGKALERLNADLEGQVAERTRQYETAYAELEAFSYATAHHLRNPLRGISGFAAILREDEDLDVEARNRLLSRIEKNTSQLGRLLDELQSYLYLSRQLLSPAAVRLDDLALRVIKRLLTDDDRERFEVEVHEMPPCWGDRTLLEGLLKHLLSNAIKFSRERQRPRIEIGVVPCEGRPGTSEAEGEVAYFVKDNGVGFDMRYSGKLFEVFQRVHAPGTYEGTGAGLAFAERIVTKHGGRIWAEGQVGKGATVYFTLPMRVQQK